MFVSTTEYVIRYWDGNICAFASTVVLMMSILCQIAEHS